MKDFHMNKLRYILWASLISTAISHAMEWGNEEGLKEVPQEIIEREKSIGKSQQSSSQHRYSLASLAHDVHSGEQFNRGVLGNSAINSYRAQTRRARSLSLNSISERGVSEMQRNDTAVLQQRDIALVTRERSATVGNAGTRPGNMYVLDEADRKRELVRNMLLGLEIAGATTSAYFFSDDIGGSCKKLFNTMVQNSEAFNNAIKVMDGKEKIIEELGLLVQQQSQKNAELLAQNILLQQPTTMHTIGQVTVGSAAVVVVGTAAMTLCEIM